MCQHDNFQGVHSFSNTHPDADALRHAIPTFSDADAFSDANTTSHSHTDPNAISHANSYTDADTDADANSHTDSNSKGIIDSGPQAGGQPVHLRHSRI